MLKWLVIILLVGFLYEIREVFPPFIVGGIIAYLLLPSVTWLSTHTRIKRSWAILFVYLLFALCIFLAFSFFGANAADQFKGLVEHRKEIVTNLLSQLSTPANPIDLDKAAEEILNSAEKTFGQPAEIMHLGALVSRSMLFCLIALVSSIYFVLDVQRLGQFFLRFLPQDKQSTAISLSQQMNVVVRKYAENQLILIGLMGAVAYIFLYFVFHLRYALVIASLCGFMEIIPILGPIFATTMATVVGVSQIGGHAFWIIPCFWAARLVEDYVIVPRVMGDAVKLHPVAVIFAVLCGETMAGALGMLIAIPVAASLKVVLDFCYPNPTPKE